MRASDTLLGLVLLFLSTLIVELTPTIELNIVNIKLKYHELETTIDPLIALPSLYEKFTSTFFRSDQNFLYRKCSNLSLEVFQQNLSSIASNLGKLTSLSMRILLLVLNCFEPSTKKPNLPYQLAHNLEIVASSN